MDSVEEGLAPAKLGGCGLARNPVDHGIEVGHREAVIGQDPANVRVREAIGVGSPVVHGIDRDRPEPARGRRFAELAERAVLAGARVQDEVVGSERHRPMPFQEGYWPTEAWAARRLTVMASS